MTQYDCVSFLTDFFVPSHTRSHTDNGTQELVQNHLKRLLLQSESCIEDSFNTLPTSSGGRSIPTFYGSKNSNTTV